MRIGVILLLAATVRAGGTFSLAGPAADYAGDIALDARGNLYVVGGFGGVVDFDPGEGSEPRTAAGATRPDAFVAKYDAGGRLCWALTFGSKEMDFARCVAVSREGFVYVAGHHSGTIDLGGGHRVETKRGRNVFLLKLAADGSVLWLRSFGDEDADIEESEDARDIALDSKGNLYLVGIFRGTIDLDPGDGKVERTSVADSHDGFLVSLTPDGKYRWGFCTGAEGPDWTRAVAVGPDDVVLIGGCFCGTVDFDPGEGKAEATSDGQFDAFLAWIASDGRFLQVATWGGYGIDHINDRSIAVDAAGAVYVSGEFKGKCDFAPGARKHVVSSDGVDGYVARFDREGELSWVIPLGAGGMDSAHSLCLAPNGSVVVTGRFQKLVDFAPGRPKHLLGAKGTAGATHAFLAVYSAEGKLAWARALGDKVSGVVKLTRGNAVAVRPNGHVVLLGTYFGDLDVAPGRRKRILAGRGSADLFVVEYDARGALVP